MKMYRNYDGNKSTFGDTSVLAGGPNPDDVSVFAAQRSKDGALTIMVVNKYLTGNTPMVINVTNYTGSGTAQVWQLNSSQVITQLANLPYSGGLLQDHRAAGKHYFICLSAQQPVEPGSRAAPD